MGEQHTPGGLERSYVFRKLNASGRFSNFGIEDVIAPLLVYAVLFLGSLVFGYSPAYCYVALAAALGGAWYMRHRFPQGGLLGLLRFFLAPRHLSAHAPDRLSRPYPAAAPPPSETRSPGRDEHRHASARPRS